MGRRHITRASGIQPTTDCRFAFGEKMISKTLSHYKITEELGHGGMAAVYQATDLRTRRSVALKVLLPHLSSDDVVRRRFLREAKAAMQLDHPGIVKVYEVGEENDRLFIAMELVEGRTLDAVMREERVAIDRAIEIGLKIADALAAAHRKGIVHRDIKPANIMVYNGNVKIMDFGLARILEASALTEKYEIVGTLHYMSPQQAVGLQTDVRSDVFSLGVLLYQLLTGTLPFEGEHPGTIIHSILNSDPLRMEELRDGIPIEVEQVVFKALQKKPQERYQDAEELRSDLERVKETPPGTTPELIATTEVFEEQARGIYSALVGRKRELDILESHLERALRGEGSTVFVRGEAGIGKSRLVWELGRRAKREKVRYLVGRCLFAEESFPYEPITEVVRSYLQVKGARSKEGLGDLIQERAPHLAERIGVIEGFLQVREDRESSVVNREQLWDTACELVRLISRDRPTVVHVEDLHWADQPTLSLLTYVARNLQGERLLIVGTYRPEDLIGKHGDIAHPLIAVLDNMRREGLCEEIDLGRLDEEATEGIIHSVFPDSALSESFVHSLYGETEGNPLFILEMLQLMRDEGVILQEDGGWVVSHVLRKLVIPGRINDVIVNRLRSLSRDERDLVDVASVEGRSFHSDTLCHCLGLPRMKVLRTLQDLEDSHHLIHASDIEYQFDHGKIRDVVYDGLIPELRNEYHRLIAEYFEVSFGERDEYAGKIAHHLLEAGKEIHSLPYLLKAGMHASRLFGNAEAIEHFDRGVEVADKHPTQLPERDPERMKLAMLKGRAAVKALIGDYDGAREDYEAMGRLAERLQDQHELAIALSGLGTTHRAKGEFEVALSYQEKALEIQRRIGDEEGTARSLYLIGVVHYSHDDYEIALRYHEEALAIQRRCGSRQDEANTLTIFGIIHYYSGNYEQALSHFASALEIQRQIESRLGEANALNNIGNVHLDLADYEISLDYYEQSLNIQKQIGNRLGEANTLNNIGNVHYGRGHYDLSLGYYEQSLTLQRSIGNRLGEANALINSGNAYLSRGEYQAALNYHEQALAIHKQIGHKAGQWESLHHLCKLWMDVGDKEKALKSVEEAGRIAEAIGTRNMRARLRIDMGMVHLLRHSPDRAHGDILKSLEFAREMRKVEATSEALGVAAALEVAAKNEPEALRHAEELLNLAEATGRVPDTARAHLILAGIHLIQGDLRQAQSHASEAGQRARECGMNELLWQAHHRLGEVYLRREEYSQALDELENAEQVIGTISSQLSDELRPTYLARDLIEELHKNLEAANAMSERRDKS
ncbi:hypothetical protein AMJ71_10985 [candidate division TA06 bacterium SM1_40]|uniref:non-specific serine/threonine protein kinase n=1 Tax=candidate division TA06 bacterium SM1_40 TaxID=1703773 RepID=A0A0S8JAA0_UNCT6|nr:MAG: hypothetical protein AMJ71_10985 [candidate division TA06 bacterium SM1_40]